MKKFSKIKTKRMFLVATAVLVSFVLLSIPTLLLQTDVPTHADVLKAINGQNPGVDNGSSPYLRQVRDVEGTAGTVADPAETIEAVNESAIQADTLTPDMQEISETANVSNASETQAAPDANETLEKEGTQETQTLPDASQQTQDTQVVPEMPGTSTLAISLDATEVTVNDQVHVQAVLSGSNASGTSMIGYAAISVVFELPDGTTAYPTQGAQVATDVNGQIALDYTPTITGTYQVRASFAGDANYYASSSSASFSADTAVEEAPEQPSTTTYTYKVLPTGEVYDASGNLVHTAPVSQSINWALGSGGTTVYLSVGDYSVEGTFVLRNGNTVFGDGDSTVLNFVNNGEFYAENADNIALENFKMLGNGQVMLRISDGYHGGYLLQNIHAYQITSTRDSTFHIYLLNGATVDNVKFIGCSAIEPRTHGFVINGASSGGWAKNIYFQDCIATYCGVYGTNTEWACGFVLAENINVDGMQLINCVADHNLESGFHFEDAPLHYNVVFQGCSASYNGITKSGVLYGSGFFMGAESKLSTISGLDTCTGTGNALGLIRYDAGI